MFSSWRSEWTRAAGPARPARSTNPRRAAIRARSSGRSTSAGCASSREASKGHSGAPPIQARNPAARSTATPRSGAAPSTGPRSGVTGPKPATGIEWRRRRNAAIWPVAGPIDRRVEWRARHERRQRERRTAPALDLPASPDGSRHRRTCRPEAGHDRVLGRVGRWWKPRIGRNPQDQVRTGCIDQPGLARQSEAERANLGGGQVERVEDRSGSAFIVGHGPS